MAEKISWSIKCWNANDRPREKLKLKGAEHLSDAELLAIVIRSGNRLESALQLARRILSGTNDSLRSLSRLSVKELQAFSGIGEVKAISILAVFELARRRGLETSPDKYRIDSSKAVCSLMQPLIGELDHEEFWILYLNNANRLEAKSQLSKGGMTATLVDVRIIFKKALQHAATSIILFHNHPSGNR